MPEIVLGRLIDLPCWEGYQQIRLPPADIPQPIRDADPSLRYLPLIELRRNDGSRQVKIGGHVISYHVTGSYPGWAAFRQEIDSTLRDAIAKLRSPQLSRIGFRYINIFRPEKHFVGGLAETNIVLKVGDEALTESVNINYTRSIKSTHIVTVRIATSDLVAGNLAPGFSLLCDIDVGTVPGHIVSSFDEAISWIDDAPQTRKIGVLCTPFPHNHRQTQAWRGLMRNARSDVSIEIAGWTERLRRR